MSRYQQSEGLYRKVESPIVESVRHTEGLYRHASVAKVQLDNPSQEDRDAIEAMESDTKIEKRILNE